MTTLGSHDVITKNDLCECPSISFKETLKNMVRYVTLIHTSTKQNHAHISCDILRVITNIADIIIRHVHEILAVVFCGNYGGRFISVYYTTLDSWTLKRYKLPLNTGAWLFKSNIARKLNCRYISYQHKALEFVKNLIFNYETHFT